MNRLPFHLFRLVEQPDQAQNQNQSQNLLSIVVEAAAAAVEIDCLTGLLEADLRIVCRVFDEERSCDAVGLADREAGDFDPLFLIFWDGEEEVEAVAAARRDGL